MERDYTLSYLENTSRDELQELSLKMLNRLIDDNSMSELFTFETDETASEDKLFQAQFDAMLRMNAIALSQLPALFNDSEQPIQNTKRMQRLLLWHFYAISFKLERTINLAVHCEHVETILEEAPENAIEWVTSLTDLLRQYALIANK